MSVYPKWIYHETLEPKIVFSKEEHEAHTGWEETPAAFVKESNAKAQEPQTDQTQTSENPKTYKEHMSEWVSKEEKAKKPRKKKGEA